MSKKSEAKADPNESADNIKITAILEAAQKRFSHFGLSKTTMGEIASDMGISKASLYYYFPDKDRLFMAVIIKEQEAFEKCVSDMILKPVKSAAKLKQFVGFQLDFFKRLLSLGKFNHMPVSELSKPFGEKLRIRHFNIEKELISKILKAGIANKEFSRFDVEAYTEMFASGISGFRALMIKDSNYNLTAEDYKVVECRMKLFTDIFIKAISK